MKSTLFLSFVVVFSMLVIPLSAINKTEDAVQTKVSQTDVPYQKQDNAALTQKVKVLKDEKVIECSLNDYLFGVVAAEMPALYEAEAIKAQTVAAYTFLLYRKESNTSTDYDISANGDEAQCFVTRSEAKTRWGKNADEYEKKIDSCIEEVKTVWLCFEEKPIFAAYHAISAGKTNSCFDVWGKDIPYLKSVDSSGDMLCEDFLSEVTLTVDELCQKLKDYSAPNTKPEDYFSNISKTENGYVKSICFGKEKISGSDIRNLLGLRSCNFTVTYSDNAFTFAVKGFGHGVGMSQTGANHMAKQGSSYSEILLHYYPDTKLQKN